MEINKLNNRTKATPCVEVWQTSILRRLRLGEENKKEEERRRRTNHSMKIYMAIINTAIIIIYCCGCVHF